LRRRPCAARAWTAPASTPPRIDRRRAPRLSLASSTAPRIATHASPVPCRAPTAPQPGSRRPSPPAADAPLAGRLPGTTDTRNRALGGWRRSPRPLPAAGAGELTGFRPGTTLQSKTSFRGPSCNLVTQIVKPSC
jgi:hypothetical protein